MNYTTFLFDFDYTLADSSRGITACFRKVLARHGYGHIGDEPIKRTIGKTLEESFAVLTGIADAAVLAGFKQEYSAEAATCMTANTVFFPESENVLSCLKNAGARIGIISTKERTRIREFLDLHFPPDFMDIVVGCEDVSLPKPSPEGLLLAVEQLGSTLRQTLYVGDSTVDAETAQAAGVDFAAVLHGVTPANELQAFPHVKIMKTLDELLSEIEK